MTEIDRIIQHLKERNRKGTLCFVGQERLQWWIKNRKKFSSPKAAMRTWTARQVVAWLADQHRSWNIPKSIKFWRQPVQNQPTVQFYNIPERDPHFANLVKFVNKACRTYKLPPITITEPPGYREWFKSQPASKFKMKDK